MPKRVAELLSPGPPPTRQPHAAIVDLLRDDPSEAYTCAEIVKAIGAHVPSWRLAGEMVVTQTVAVTSALVDLLHGGLIVQSSDGTDVYYHYRAHAPREN